LYTLDNIKLATDMKRYTTNTVESLSVVGSNNRFRRIETKAYFADDGLKTSRNVRGSEIV